MVLMKLKGFFGGRWGTCQKALWIMLREMRCANKVALLCFVACWFHTQGSFLSSTVQNRIPEGFSGFVFDFMRHAQPKCGWLLSEFELCLFLRKIKMNEGLVGGKRRQEIVCIEEKAKYMLGECEIRQSKGSRGGWIL